MWSTWAGIGCAAAVVFVLSACSDGGNVVYTNDSASTVTVVDGEDEFTVDVDSSAVVLGEGCTEGHVQITYPTRTVTVDGPVCPDREVVIGDDGVQLVEVDPQDG